MHIADETIQGLGRIPFLQSMFGAIIAIARPPTGVQQPYGARPAAQQTFPPILHSTLPITAQDSKPRSFPWDPGESSTLQEMTLPDPKDSSGNKKKVLSLTELLPAPGYFLAGGIAGVVSRTATAPLDRLKVYLIAQTGTVKKETAEAVKSGAPIQATKVVTRPLIDATKTLWRMGGMRSLFAGKFQHLLSLKTFTDCTGNGLNVVKVMPESAIKFGSYEVEM